MRNLTYFFLFFCCLTIGQDNEHAWVYFNDKPNFETYLDNPNLILTEKSIQKKNNKNVPIDYLDVPVYKKFVDSILSIGNFEYIAKSKGFLLVSSSPLTRSSYHADEDFAKLQKNRINQTNAQSIS